MIRFSNIRTPRAALGAALLTFFTACSDVPSGLRQPLPGPAALEEPIRAVADRPLVGLPVLQPRAGERLQRRSLRGADGQVLVVESVLDAAGRPRESVITRNGSFAMRIDNEWAGTASRRLSRQVALVRGEDGRVRTFDSRDISPTQLADAREKLRFDAAQMTRQQAGRVLHLEAEMGVCDKEVKAADQATWQYVAAGAALLSTSATGNILAAMASWVAYVASYENYQSKQSDLDACVDRAGKKPAVDEY